MGRKRTPTAMLKAQGRITRDDRHGNKMEAKLSIPQPPTLLSEVSQEAYDFIATRLYNMG